MKLVLTIIFLISFTVNLFSQVEKIKFESYSFYSILNREYVLTEIEQLFEKLILQFDTAYGGHFINKYSGVPILILDITDSTNNNFNSNNISFFNNRIYQFTCLFYKYSYNNVLVIHEENLVFFSAMNCKCGGNSLDELNLYLKSINYTDAEIITYLSIINNMNKNFKTWSKDNYTELKCSCN